MPKNAGKQVDLWFDKMEPGAKRAKVDSLLAKLGLAPSQQQGVRCKDQWRP